MEITLKDIINVENVFKKLIKMHFVNYKISLKIALAYKDIDEKVKFYTDEEAKLVEDYAEKDDNGKVKLFGDNQIHFKNPEDSIKFHEGITSLQNTKVEIFDKFSIDISDFKGDSCDLTPVDILILNDFIEIKTQETLN